MPRAIYKITEQDFLHVSQYLYDRVMLRKLHLCEEPSWDTAEKAFFEVYTLSKKSNRSGLLNAWCEEHLTKGDWQKLKAAVRKRRERTVQYGESRSITISKKAHDLLVKIAERDYVTFSDVLESVLPQVLNSARKIRG